MIMDEKSPTTKKTENPLLTIIFNIAAPAYIQSNGHKWMKPELALIVALLFPLLYGLYDYVKQKKTNYISIIGLLNVSMTGGLALLKLEGIWFSIKEATFPLIIGSFVFASSFTKNPFIKILFFNPQILKIDLINQEIEKQSRQNQMLLLLKNSTILLSLSFLLSAVLNFLLAYTIFKPIPIDLSDTQRAEMLNMQIGEMTKLSHLIIMIPSMAVLGGVLYYIIKKLKEITGLEMEQLFHS